MLIPYCRFASVFAILAMVAPPLSEAHFVWMRVDGNGEQTTSHLFFSEAGNVDGDRIPENIADATATIHIAGSEPQELDLSESTIGDFVSQSAVTDGGRSFCVSTECQYGLYHGMLLHYSAKAIHVTDPASLPEISKNPSARLDIVPTLRGGKLVIGVSWDGQPFADAGVQVTDPHGDDHELKTDAQGAAELGGLQAGLYTLRTHRNDKSASGEVAGEDYTGASYYSTMTMRLPAGLQGRDVSEASRSADRDSAYPLLPVGVSSFGAAVNNGWLYVYGGHTGRAHAHSRDNLSKHFCRIKLAGGEAWEALPMQRPLQGLAMVSHGGYVYRIGGLEALNAADEDEQLRSVRDFCRFDVKRKTWESLPSLPAPRSSHDAVVVGDKLYVIGGWTLTDDGDEQWLYNGLMVDLTAAELKWETFEVPFERRALAVGTRDGLVYVLGGITSLGEIDRSVSVYDPASDEFSKGPELPGTGMDGFGVSAWQVRDRLLVSGVSGAVLELTADGNRWSKVGQLRHGRFFHRLLPADDGSLLAVAGASMQGHLANIERFEIR